ncbi:hypothetical protein COOONC_13725, partial [Cooperia oncophora]
DREKKSIRSLQSGPSTVTSSNSKYDRAGSIFIVAMLDNEPALITRHPLSLLSNATQHDCLKMRKLDHENVNKFLGFSYDGIDYIVVWKICGRGSLQAIFSKFSISNDAFFTLCLIRDVAEDKEKKSIRSLQSGPSTVTSSNSKYDRAGSIFIVAMLDNEPALITRHPLSLLSNATQHDCLKVF